jgi:uncharacterized protein (TIGR03083 family)
MPIDHVAALRREGATLAAAARSAPLDAPVPGCPGWDVQVLVGHVGRVYRWATEAVTGGGQAPAGYPPRPPDDVDIVDWYEASLATLLDALANAEPSAPAWNFPGVAPATAAFWARRQANETAVHRWDAESATAATTPIDADLATDAVDEMVAVLVPFRLASKGDVDLGGSIHLHCTDVEGEWTIRTEGGSYQFDRGHAKGDAALRGPASQLLLVTWGRIPPDAEGLELFGDRALLDRLQQLLNA